MFQIPANMLATRKLENLVENRTVHSLKHAELNLFETHKTATEVLLTFPDPVLASMITGKKIMHLPNMPSFDFLPGESVILPPNELMTIDFPEADFAKPTKCLALRFDNELLNKAVNQLNEVSPKQDGTSWRSQDYSFHFTNDVAINQLIQRLIFIFAENHSSKDIFSDMVLHEMTIRILQLEQQHHYIERSKYNSNSCRFSFIINFIRNHITENLTVSLLSSKANMSESNFYKAFKNELGITPNDFIIEERLRAVESLLRNPLLSIKEAYLESGFNSFSYFCKIFKKKHKVPPGEYREQVLGRL